MKRILIADDAPFIITTIEQILRDYDFMVVGKVNDGLSALFQYLKLKPNIILMDISMPKMDGISATKEIRKHDPTAKILILSALGEKEYVQAAIKAGANNFIVKPFEIDTFINILNTI